MHVAFNSSWNTPTLPKELEIHSSIITVANWIFNNGSPFLAIALKSSSNQGYTGISAILS